LTCHLIGDIFKTVTGEVLTAKEMNAFNSFENPETIKPAQFTGYKLKDGILTITMPAKSVVVLELKK
jgi:alpha-L-arabinofuranosidase